MSSRLLKAADSESAETFAWQPPGAGGSAAYVSRREPLRVADDVEARVKAAYQQGRNESEAAANQRAMQKLEPVIAAMNRLLQELASLRKDFRAEAERDTVKLAIAIARRVLHRELATDPDAILGLVIAAFQKLNARETHRLRLSPSDAAAIQENRGRIELPAGLEISTDASLARGSVIFETARGELDASISTQLAEIDRGLADMAAKRSR